MGIFSRLKSGWNSFTKSITRAAGSVGRGVSKASNVIREAAVVVEKKAEKIVNQVYNDGKSVVKFSGDIVKGGQALMAKAIDKTGDTLSSLSMPIAIGIGVLGIFLLKR